MNVCYLSGWSGVNWIVAKLKSIRPSSLYGDITALKSLVYYFSLFYCMMLKLQQKDVCYFHRALHLYMNIGILSIHSFKGCLLFQVRQD